MKRPLMAVCMCFVALMAVWFLVVGFCPQGQEAVWPETVKAWNGEKVTVTGHVYRKDTKYFYLDSVLIQIQAAGQQQNISFRDNLICEYTEMPPKLGSSVNVIGIFHCFSHATNPGEFDSATYYQSLGIGGKLREITVLTEGGSYSVWQESLFELREYFRGRLYRILPEKEAAIMAAMLLGDKSELDEETKRLYQDNGIIHILSISGLHITIIGMSIYKMLRRMGVPVGIAAAVGGSVTVCYGVLTGMSISACRAIGMFLIKMLGEIVGRTYDMLTAMGMLAAGMVGINPLYLKNAGFLLSYGAILGIGVLYPILLQEEKTDMEKWKAVPVKSILSGISVTLMTLPILLWFYYRVPTYSVFLNLLVLPLMTPVMLTGLIAMLVPGLGIVATMDCLIFKGYEWLCQCFGNLPFSTWNPGRPEIWQIIIYYGILLMVIWLHGNRKDIGKKLNYRERGIQIIALTAAVIIIGSDFSKKTTVTFLDVGQGDCICVQLDSGENYIFDCGSSSRSGIGEYVLLPYLRYCGIDYIDAVFVSHPDKDHCNGIEELLVNGEGWGITVGELVLPDVGERQEPVKLVKNAPQKVKVSFIKAGDYWECEDCRFLCLHPPKKVAIEDTNAYSQCFYIELGQGVRVLLTGDVEETGEELLLGELQQRDIRDITVLKVAHHGSKFSSDEQLLQQIQPQVAVISCGAGNFYGHPHEETLEQHRYNQNLHAHNIIHASAFYGFFRFHTLNYGFSQVCSFETGCLCHIFSRNKRRNTDFRTDGFIVVASGFHFLHL